MICLLLFLKCSIHSSVNCVNLEGGRGGGREKSREKGRQKGRKENSKKNVLIFDHQCGLQDCKP